ncbi:glycosyl transferase family 4 [Crinalium epipsammum PCC 9333]|uniref:Glycosyl transferase family 4 n=1 Tax=Crinalium epipsammum PCC 9333 TaxID=1173022 RepID=K9W3J7_9CYAN|nr:glycosyl transferase family 4 [Crinalium epipsammum PCC 9333]
MDLLLSLVSFIISLLTVALIKQRFSRHLLDTPNERSSHTQPTPRGGGLGFIIAFAVTSAIYTYVVSLFTPVADKLQLIPLLPLWLVYIPLIAVGIFDDRGGVSAIIRYLVQLFAAILAVTAFGSFPWPWLSQLGEFGSILSSLLTIISITALINFYNFMDGLDGLVAGVTTVQLGLLALLLNQPILWLLVAALLGFLWWNWSPAKIFMGDAGSTFLGASVAMALLNYGKEPVPALYALAISLPMIGDAVYTLARRLYHRENIFQAHRTHLYQRLQQSGWSHALVATTYICITLMVDSSISIWGTYAAMISVLVIATLIILGELYLQSRSEA